MATFYLDLVNGNDANTGADWANAWKTFTNGATAARIAPGDEIRVAKTPDPTSIGNATWTSRSSTVTLATAQTATIDNCETAWTAANTATVTRVTTPSVKQGTYVAQIVTPAATATSTLYAYFAVGGAGGLNLSAYQQITLWFRNNTTAVADANRYQIRLCSDTAGVTAVDTFDIPAIPSTGVWVPLVITKNGGGNLGNAIKSIALYTGTSSPGNSQTILMDNISASATNGLNLTSLISKNSTADFTLNDAWWALGAIDNTTVTIGMSNNDAISAYRGYYTEGTSPETVTTYIRSTVNSGMVTSGSVQLITDSGTAGNLITFTGGWDTTSNTRTGMTFIDGQNNLGNYLDASSRSFIRIQYFGFVRYSVGYIDNTSSANNSLQYIYGAAVNSAVISMLCQTGTVDSVFAHAAQISVSPSSLSINSSNLYHYTSNGSGIALGSTLSTNSNIYASNHASNGITISSSRSIYTNLTAKYNAGNFNITLQTNALNTLYNVTATNGTYGLNFSASNQTVYNYTSSANSASVFGSTYGNRINNWTYSEATPVLWSSGGYTKEVGADYINGSPVGALYAGYTVSSNPTFSAIEQSVTTKPGTGSAWQCNVLNTIHNASLPAVLSVAKIAVNSGTAVTVKAWVKKSHATNISAALVVPKLTIQGVSSDVIANKSNDTNWEELTVSFTPTVSGVAEIQFWSWSTTGSTTSSTFIDSMTVTQA